MNSLFQKLLFSKIYTTNLLLNVNLTKIQLYIAKIKLLETNPPARNNENTATTFKSLDPNTFEVGLYRKEKKI